MNEFASSARGLRCAVLLGSPVSWLFGAGRAIGSSRKHAVAASPSRGPGRSRGHRGGCRLVGPSAGSPLRCAPRDAALGLQRGMGCRPATAHADRARWCALMSSMCGSLRHNGLRPAVPALLPDEPPERYMGRRLLGPRAHGAVMGRSGPEGICRSGPEGPGRAGAGASSGAGHRARPEAPLEEQNTSCTSSRDSYCGGCFG